MGTFLRSRQRRKIILTWIPGIQFTVDAVLMEYVNGNWVTATDNSGTPLLKQKSKISTPVIRGHYNPPAQIYQRIKPE